MSASAPIAVSPLPPRRRGGPFGSVCAAATKLRMSSLSLRATRYRHHGAAGLRAVREFRACSRTSSGGSFLPTRPGIRWLRTVRRAAFHLRHAGDVGAGTADRNSAGRRRGDFSGRTGAARDFLWAHLSDRAAGGRSQRDLRIARDFRAGSDPAKHGAGDPGAYSAGRLCLPGRSTA